LTILNELVDGWMPFKPVTLAVVEELAIQYDFNNKLTNRSLTII